MAWSLLEHPKIEHLSNHGFQAVVVHRFFDIYIYQETGNTPSSHTDRFNILRKKFEEVYDLMDKDFPYYQDSYVQIMSKELAEVIKNDAKTMAEKTKIKL